MSNVVNMFACRATHTVPPVPVESLGDVFNEREAAALVGVTPAALAAWREGGTGPLWLRALGVAGGIAYPAKSFMRWLNTLPRCHGVPMLPTAGDSSSAAKQPRIGSMRRAFNWRSVQRVVQGTAS